MNNLNFIIKCCAEGDAKQQKVLYERYYGYALSIASRYIYQPEETCFVVNDSFIKFFRSINRFVYANTNETEPQLMAWLKKIIVNTAIDELRRRTKPFENILLAEDEMCDADSWLLYKELIQKVRALPKAYSVVFTMHVIDGFKHCEIAQQLDISIGTSKSNLFKAKTYLRKLINAESVFSFS